MIRQELQDYIKQQLAQGVNKEIIINSLIGAGWQKAEIDEALNAIYLNSSQTSSQIPSAPLVEQITENNYPVQPIWVLKSMLGFVFAFTISIFLLLIGYINFYLILLILYTPIYFIIVVLRRKNFHYLIDKEFMVIKQGVLSKKQRNIPYGVIQNVFVKQDLFDRLFGLASVTIENASQAGGKENNEQKVFGMKMRAQNRQQVETVGFTGNKVSIPGLTKQNAEALKNTILERIKANPIEELGL